MSVGILPACMCDVCVYTICMLGVDGGQKKEPGSQMAVNHNVGARSQTQVLSKSLTMESSPQSF